MNKIEKPDSRTFWKINANGKEIKGLTEINQVTSTRYAILSDTNADNVYSPLPNSGELLEGEIYSYQGGMVVVQQDHDRTNSEPSETPDLLSIYRANTEGDEWVAYESVIIGDKRIYKGVNYACIETHTTKSDLQPDQTPKLWKENYKMI